MANILYLLREEASRTLLENGVAGVGGLQTGEMGFNNDAAALEFSYKRRNGAGFVRVPTREALLFAAAALTSGAKGIGYYPAAGLTATNVQDAMDQLAALAGSGGGGGTIGGTLTTGKIPKASGASTLADSILSEASSKLLFSGDAVANLYRDSAGILKSDGGAIIAGTGEVQGNFTASGALALLYKQVVAGLGYEFDNAALDTAAAFLIDPTLTKNNSNTRQFHTLRIRPTLNAGGSNANATINLIDVDSVNASLTGLAVNLMRLAFGGTEFFRVNSAGDIFIPGLNNHYLPFMSSGKLASSLLYYDDTNTRLGVGITPQTGLHLARDVGNLAAITLEESTATPSSPSSSDQVRIYEKADKLIIQFNDGGTVKYFYLDLTSTAGTWAYTTSAP